MTKEDALRLKGEAHDWARALVPDLKERVMFDHIRDARLIQLVEEHEREACAKLADAYADGLERNYCEIIADAIRARGQ